MLLLRPRLLGPASLVLFMPLQLVLLVRVEARGKGGAANGGGNSWRGGERNSNVLQYSREVQS